MRDPLPQLRKDLRALHRDLDEPSYRQLAALCPGGKPARQTIGNLMSGPKRQDWPTVRAVVEAMRRFAEQEKLPQPRGTFDLVQWEERYRSERYRDDPAQVPSLITPAGNGLPAAVEVTGRAAELEMIADLLAVGDHSAPVTVIVGMAGVGKTALAMRAAHDAWATSAFADALFVDLQGYDPERRVAPHAGLGLLLGVLGVENTKIPQEPAERVAQWRRLLAERAGEGRRVLLVVDNAFSASDVEPFVPGVGEHRVLVTSRHTLTDLPQPRLIELGVLSRGASVAVLRQALAARSEDRYTDEEPDGLSTVAELCGDLPLALALSAALLLIEPDMPVTDLAAELSDSTRRLSALDSGDNRAVRAALFLSYRHLDDEEARFFRLLAIHPGTHLAADTAGKLADVAVPMARQLLRLLRRAHLLEPGTATGTYRFHDLVRDYAFELVNSDIAGEQEAARDRLYGYYAKATCDAQRCLLDAQRNTVWIGPGDPPVSCFESKAQARSWLDAERSNLVAAIIAASSERRWSRLCAVAENLQHYMEWSCRIDDAIVVYETALAASTHLKRKQRMVAAACCGNVYRIAGRYPEARQLLVEARDIARSLRDKAMEARIQHNLGLVHHRMRNYADAEACHRFDLKVCERNGDAGGAAHAMNALGDALRGRKQFDEAVHWLQLALVLFRRSGDRWGQALAQSNLILVKREHLPQIGLSATIVEQCEVLALCRSAGAVRAEAKAYSDLALLYFDRCPRCHHSSVLQWSARSMEMAHDLGDKQLWAHALGIGGLGHAGIGNRDEAKAALEQAATTFRKMDLVENAEGFEARTNAVIAAYASLPEADRHPPHDGWTELLDELPHAILRGDAKAVQDARSVFHTGPE